MDSLVIPLVLWTAVFCDLMVWVMVFGSRRLKPEQAILPHRRLAECGLEQICKFLGPMNKFPKILILILSIFIAPLFSAGTVEAFIDIGLRLSQNISAGSSDVEIVPIAVDPLGTLISPLRIAKGGNIYGVALVDITDPAATKTRIKLASGLIKALRKFGVEPQPGTLQLADAYADAIGHCTGSLVVFYGSVDINNNTSKDAQLVRTAFNPIHLESAPSSFTVPANTTISKGGFGQLGPYSSCEYVLPPEYYVGTGSATYSVSQDGAMVDTVTYYWTYAF